MKKLILCLLVLQACVLHAQKKPKVVYIIIDGVSPDVIESIQTPFIDDIAKKGSYLRTYQGGRKDYSVSPTISSVGYNNILTGVWFNKHNVPDNAIKDPNYHYPSMFRLLKDTDPTKKIAIFSSWKDNRTKLLGENLPQTNHLKIDEVFDGYELDTVSFPHDAKKDYMFKIDEHVSEEAAKTIGETGPDLSWVYLEYTDDAGHMYGDQQPFYDAVKKADTQVGRIWEAVKQRQQKFKEDWLIIVTTDHGRSEDTGKDHGGQSDRQRATWLVSNVPLDNIYARYGMPSAVDILPTIMTFMQIEVPRNYLFELDGISLLGDVAIANPQMNQFQNQIDLSWTALKREGNVKIWLTSTNNFAKGEQDKYQLMGEVPVKQGHFLINTKDIPSSFYKIVLETKENSVNRWIKN